jgi:hypothetical protein
MGLADALIYFLGSLAVAQYSQALYTDQIAPDPTLNRSLRSLRRVLRGQWLAWTNMGLAAVPGGPVEGLVEWYTAEQNGAVAGAYTALRDAMVSDLAYKGDYGPRETAAPRHLLELVDQYRIRRSKAEEGTLPPGFDATIANALLLGLHELLHTAAFLTRYPLYAPKQRHLLMGLKPASPMPPIPAPADAEATLLLYPPGELPDYTKRPNLQDERLPLFPLDPLLVYASCRVCGTFRVAALPEVIGGTPRYLGVDPECGHTVEGEKS